jgi:hypothetical protein
MKWRNLFYCILCCALWAWVGEGQGHASSIQVLDGTTDGDNTVSLNVLNFAGGTNLYYRTNSGSWNLLGTTPNFSLQSLANLSIVDFALDFNNDGKIVGTGDRYSFTNATITVYDMSNAIATKGISATILWNDGGKFDLVFTQNNCCDQLQTVPIPAAGILFGSGLLGMMGIGLKRKRKTLTQ